MIVYLPLFNVIFPGNIDMFLSIIISIATFDVIPFVEEIQAFFFRFEYINDDNDQPASGWGSLGFETKNFTVNSGSLFIVAAVFVIKKFAEFITKYLQRCWDFWVPIYVSLRSD